MSLWGHSGPPASCPWLTGLLHSSDRSAVGALLHQYHSGGAACSEKWTGTLYSASWRPSQVDKQVKSLKWSCTLSFSLGTFQPKSLDCCAETSCSSEASAFFVGGSLQEYSKYLVPLSVHPLYCSPASVSSLDVFNTVLLYSEALNSLTYYHDIWKWKTSKRNKLIEA